LAFDLFVLAVVVVYLVTAPSYRGVAHLFPEAVGYPTAILAVLAVVRWVYLRFHGPAGSAEAAEASGTGTAGGAEAAGRPDGARGGHGWRDWGLWGGREQGRERYKPLAGLILVVVYLALLPVLGFVIATLVLLIGGPLVLGVRLGQLWRVAIVAVIFTVGLLLLFSSNSGIVLPHGLAG
jgi:hypothetical protein